MNLLSLAALLLSFQVLPAAVAVASPGDAIWRSHSFAYRPATPHLQEGESTDAYLHRLGLGSKISVSFVFSAEEPDCLKQVDFYKRLMAVPGMDGKGGRVIMFTRDGAVPAFNALQDKNLKVHATGSFPREAGSLPTALGSVAVLDKAGVLLKSWNGFLSAAQQDEVLEFVQSSLR